MMEVEVEVDEKEERRWIDGLEVEWGVQVVV